MQVPRHDFRVVEDEGGEVVKISVELPGVTSASEITVRIEPPHIVHVVVPDRYRLLLQLAVPIAAIADSVRFKKKTCKLTMCCRVQASTAQEPAAAEPADEQQQQAPQQQQEAPQQQQQWKAGRNRQRQQQQHNQQQARTVAAVQAAAQQQLRELQEALEESATEGALDMQCQEDQQAQQQQQQQEQQAALERQRQQEEEQRQEEERLRKEAEDAAAEEETAQAWQLLQQKWQREAEAAAAAELERQVQAEQQRQQEEAAAAAAEKQRQMQAEQQRQQEKAAVAAAAAAEKHHRLQEQQAAAEAAAAAAAVDKQRQWQAQQRKLQQQQAAAEAAAKRVLREQRAREEREMANMAAAQEWLSRGSTAVSQRNTELASRALSKATELDPCNTWGLQQLSNQLDKLRQQQAAAAASPAALAGRALSSSTSVSSPVSNSSRSSAVSCQTPLADALGRGIAAGSTEGTDDSDKPDKGAQQQQQQQSTQASDSWDGFVTTAVAHVRQSCDIDPLALLERPQSWNLLWWCLTVILALLYGGLRACLKATCFFLDSTKQEGGGWLWAKTWTVRQALRVPAFLFLVMGNMCVAPMFLFQYAWTLPLAFAGAFESDTGFPGAESRNWMERLSEASPGELRPGMIKLGLASVSAAVVYGLVWLTCLAQLGGHSLAGWLLILLLLVWHTVVWVWDFVLWDPPAWYPLQITAAWLATFMACLDNQVTFITWCMRALFSLQVMLAGGKMVRFCSIAITGLWRYLGFDWMELAMDAGKKMVPDTAVPAGADVVEHAAAAAAADDPSATTAPKQRLVPLWQCAVLGMSPMIVRSWLLALSYCSFMQQPLAAAADILVSLSVHGAHTLACVLSTVFALKDGLVRTMAFLVAGPWGLFVSCWPVRTLLAAVKLLPLQPLSFLGQAMAALLVAPIKFVAALPYRLAAGVLRIAAWALMGVLTWALPLSVVEPLVQESCAVMGQWRDSCQQLLGPHVSSMASESLSLPHSWWFTVVLQLWLGFLLGRITYWYAHFDELMQQQQAQGEKERKEAARHKKEQKVQQRRQLRKQGR